MEGWGLLGKILIAFGLGLAVVGVLLTLTDRYPGLSGLFGWVGRLPGDISIKRDNFRVYFPLATSVVLSLALSLVVYLLSWLFRR